MKKFETFKIMHLLIVMIMAILLVVIFFLFQKYNSPSIPIINQGLLNDLEEINFDTSKSSTTPKADKILAGKLTGVVHIPKEGVIVVSDGPGGGLIMSDKNVGASIAGTGTISYGNHFQWGRNKGFPSTGEVKTQNVLIQSGTMINVLGNDIYDFVITGADNNKPPHIWAKDNNDIKNNWSGKNKQGPCEEGFHVPTKDEWISVIQIGYFLGLWGEGFMIDEITWNVPSYRNWSEEDKNKISNLLLLPLVQSRYRGDGSVAHYDRYGFYWTSSVDGKYSNHFTLSAHQIDATYHASRSAGLAIRCFKD